MDSKCQTRHIIHFIIWTYRKTSFNRASYKVCARRADLVRLAIGSYDELDDVSKGNELTFVRVVLLGDGGRGRLGVGTSVLDVNVTSSRSTVLRCCLLHCRLTNTDSITGTAISSSIARTITVKVSVKNIYRV